jgi:hypothetical protein
MAFQMNSRFRDVASLYDLLNVASVAGVHPLVNGKQETTNL